MILKLFSSDPITQQQYESWSKSIRFVVSCINYNANTLKQQLQLIDPQSFELNQSEIFESLCDLLEIISNDKNVISQIGFSLFDQMIQSFLKVKPKKLQATYLKTLQYIKNDAIVINPR